MCVCVCVFVTSPLYVEYFQMHGAEGSHFHLLLTRLAMYEIWEEYYSMKSVLLGQGLCLNRNAWFIIK